MRGTGIRLQARTRHYVSVMLDTLEGRGWREFTSHVLHPAKGGEGTKKPGVQGKGEAWGGRAPRPSGDNTGKKAILCRQHDQDTR